MRTKRSSGIWIQKVNTENIEKRRSLRWMPGRRCRRGDVAGRAVYYLDGKEIGSANLVFTEDIEKATYPIICASGMDAVLKRRKT